MRAHYPWPPPFSAPQHPACITSFLQETKSSQEWDAGPLLDFRQSSGLRKCCHHRGSRVSPLPWLHSDIGGPTPGKIETLPLCSALSFKFLPMGLPSFGTLFCPQSPQALGQRPYLDSCTQGTMAGPQGESLNLCARVGVDVNTVIFKGTGSQSQRAPQSERFWSPTADTTQLCPVVPISWEPWEQTLQVNG